MSWSKQVTIWCDGEDCGHWDQFSLTLTGANREVKRIGWQVHGRYHLCPKCVEKLKESKS